MERKKMANMSYCLFENTLHDLRSCIDALYDGRELSRSEAAAADAMIRGFASWMEASGIIDRYNIDAIEDIFR
jgi:hypothetical protein